MSASFSYKERTHNSITISVSVDSTYPYYQVYWRLPNTTASNSSGWMWKSSDFDYKISGLSASTKYVINVQYAKNNQPKDGEYGFCGAREIWTADPPKPPKISWFSVSQTAINEKKARCTWSATDLVSGATYEIYSFDIYGNQHLKSSGQATAGSATISFNDFGTYNVELVLANGNEESLKAYKTVSVTLNSVTQWDWNKSNGRATASQTQAAYRAITNRGKLTDFSYLVWNDMCAKMLALLNARGVSWNSRYLSYDNTLMSSYDKTMTAARMNSLRYNVWSGWDAISRGSKIYGSYFTDITDSINNGISQL